MSKVDLSTAKQGDVVHFRCGGSAEIELIEPITFEAEFYKDELEVTFKGDTELFFYQENGNFFKGHTMRFDIVKVESK